MIGNSSSTTSHDSPKPAVLQSFAGHSHNSPPQPPFSPPQSLTTLSVHRLSINSQNTPQPDVFSRSALDTVQSQQLPRIRPLDIRDQSTRENGLALVLPEPECSLQETYSPSGLALVQTHSISSINHIPGMLLNFYLYFTHPCWLSIREHGRSNKSRLLTIPGPPVYGRRSDYIHLPVVSER